MRTRACLGCLPLLVVLLGRPPWEWKLNVGAQHPLKFPLGLRAQLFLDITQPPALSFLSRFSGLQIGSCICIYSPVGSDLKCAGRGNAQETLLWTDLMPMGKQC